QKKTPIGYNIYIPPEAKKITEAQKIQNVVITIYGGAEIIDKEQSVQKPGALDSIQATLLKNNTIVITLNLPDLLELNEFQLKMPEALFNKIHACIHKFYDTLKYHPEKISHYLKKI